MNEQIRPNPELTARQQYSTLNTRSTMAQDGNNEQPPQRPRPEGSHRSDGSEKDNLWRRRASQSWREGNIDETQARRILEELMASQKPGGQEESVTPTTSSYSGARVGSEVHPYKYDAYNMTHPEEDGEDPGWSKAEEDAYVQRFASSNSTNYLKDAKVFAKLMEDPEANAGILENLYKKVNEKAATDSETTHEGMGLSYEIGEALRSMQKKDKRHQGDDPEQNFNDEEISLLSDHGPEGKRFREVRFNLLFKDVDSRPSSSFREAFNSFYDEPKFRAFLKILRAEEQKLKDAGQIDEAEKFARESRMYEQEFSVRETLHDANYILTTNIGVDKISEFASRLTSGQMDLAFRKKGASAAMHFYEQALIKVREENFGYLPYKDVVGDITTGKLGRVEILARQYMKKALAAGVIYESVGTDPNTGLEKKQVVASDNMQDWEVDRAFAIARGMGVMTGRFVEIAITSKIPKSRYTSMWAHGMLGSLSPFRHSIGKFNISDEKNRFLAYKLEPERGKWSMEELKEVTNDMVFNMVNDLVSDEDQRLLGKVNPLHIGGIMSKTGWRVAGNPKDSLNPDDKKYKYIENKNEIVEGNPMFDDTSNSAIGLMVKASRLHEVARGPRGEVYDPFEWIGTGVLIDKVRGDLNNPEKSAKAKEELRRQLTRTAKMLPTRLLFNVKEARASALRQFGSDAMTRPDFQNALDELIVVQEKAIQEHSETLDFSIIGNGVLRGQAKQIADFIKEQYVGGGGETRFMRKLMEDYGKRDWKTPFISGTEDVPWDEYQFANVGGNIVQRRWNDIGNAAKAGTAIHEMVGKLLYCKNQDQIIELLQPIHASIEQYDLDRANQVAYDLALGIDRFFAKDAIAMLPLVGGVAATISGKASFAQVATGGRHGMAWDERGHYDFSRKLRNSKIITDEQVKKLQKTTEGTPLHLGKRYVIVALQMLALAMLIQLMSATQKNTLAAA